MLESVYVKPSFPTLFVAKYPNLEGQRFISLFIVHKIRLRVVMNVLIYNQIEIERTRQLFNDIILLISPILIFLNSNVTKKYHLINKNSIPNQEPTTTENEKTSTRKSFLRKKKLPPIKSMMKRTQ